MTDQVDSVVTKNRLLLSIFPGVDLFGKPFEERGFSVVRGPDLIYGQDIRNFHVPAGCFAGVIGDLPAKSFRLLIVTNLQAMVRRCFQSSSGSSRKHSLIGGC